MAPFWSNWSRQDIPNLQGRVAVVTGGNSGIGYEVARQLLDHGAQVALVGRNQQLVEWAVEDLQEEFPDAQVKAFTCNLEVLQEVRSLAAELLAAYPAIHILVNNAGRYLDADFETTSEGIERVMAANYWGAVFLTLLMLERLIGSRPSRVINMVSEAEAFATLDLDDITGVDLGHSSARSGIAMYGRSKLQMIMFTFELQRRLEAAGVTALDAFVTHPGLTSSAMFNKLSFQYPFSWLSYLWGHTIGRSIPLGASSILYTATSPNLTHKGGRYYGPNYLTNSMHTYERPVVNPRAYDKAAAAQLWQATLQQLEVVPGGLPSWVLYLPVLR